MRANKQKTKAAVTTLRRSKAQRLTVTQLADAVGISDRVLQKHFARGCPRGPVAAVKKWRADNISVSRRRLGEQETPDPTKVDLEKQKLREDVRYKKLRTDKLADMLVLRAYVDQALAEMLVQLKGRLMQIPDELQGLCKRCTKQARIDIAEKIRLALKELSELEI